MRTRKPPRRTIIRLQPLEDRAQPSGGALDSAFNGTGYVVTAVSSHDDYAYSVLVQPDHKVLAVGLSFNRRGLQYKTYVVRYLENGARDPSFDGDGIAAISAGTNNSVTQVALQPDGKILLAGWSSQSGTGNDLTVVRLNPNGSVDKSFGNRGVVTTHLGSSEETVRGIDVRPDGKIVIAGSVRLPTGGNGYDFALARYNPNGTLDPSFGAGGTVVTNLRGLDDRPYALALQPDGRILVAGSSDFDFQTNFVVARYTEAGALDTDPVSGFGAPDGTGARPGYAAVAFSAGEGIAEDLGIQPDGRIVAAGRGLSWGAAGADYDFAVARFTPDGLLDPSFNGAGVATVDFAGGTNFDADYGRSVAIQPDGKLVVAGDPAPVGFGLARLNPDGTLDPTFGSGGRVVTPDGGLRDAYEVALQPWDGKIVACGVSGGDFAVARYLGDEPVTPVASGAAGPTGVTELAAVTPDGWDEVVSGPGRRRRA